VRDGDRAVELDDRRRLERRERGVERRYAGPVGRVRRRRSRVARGDRGLKRIRSWRAVREDLGALERFQPETDQEPVPARAILIEQQDRLSRRVRARRRARLLDLEQRHEPMHLGLIGSETREHAREPQRVLA